MLDLLVAWATITFGLLASATVVDSWMEPASKRLLAEKLGAHLRPDPMRWLHGISIAFVTVFDFVYGTRNTRPARLVWQAILFSYILFFEARLTLWLFRLPVPAAYLMLTTAIGTAVGTIMLLEGFFAGSELLFLYRTGSWNTFRTAIRSPEYLRPVLIGMCGMALYTMLTAATAVTMGAEPRFMYALTFGALLVLPTILLVSCIPARVHPVDPFRALISSLVFMGLMAIWFRAPAQLFLARLRLDGAVALSLVAFNIFADAISLVETRGWLFLSREAGLLRLILLLAADLIVSAAIYLVLPAIVGQNLSVFWPGIVFQGGSPWIGILFWTSFSTSLLFYLFVAGALALRLMMPIAYTVHWLGRFMEIEAHPVRGIAIAMVEVESALFLIGVVRLAVT
jgi:hypothetical protein